MELKCYASAYPEPEFYWSFEGRNISGVHSGTSVGLNGRFIIVVFLLVSGSVKS